MPIQPEHRFFYPINLPQLSAVIRFGGRKATDGRMGSWSTTSATAADEAQRPIDGVADGAGGSGSLQMSTYSVASAEPGVVLAAAHRDHTSNNRDGNLAAFCRRHTIHYRPEHER